VAEGGGLLNRCRGSTPTVSSNLIPSANLIFFNEISHLDPPKITTLTNDLTNAYLPGRSHFERP
jgi:hypothetical protein